MSNNWTRRRSGFATFSAVVLIGTTAIVLAMFARLSIEQVNRAGTQAIDAQLRQMLHAGQVYVHDTTPNALGEESYEIALPAALSHNDHASLAVRFERPIASEPVAILVARQHDRTMSQTMIYDTDEYAWRVVDVLLP